MYNYYYAHALRAREVQTERENEALKQRRRQEARRAARKIAG